MDDDAWKKYLEQCGSRNAVIVDLASQFSGRPPSYSFNLWWFNDNDEGKSNFRNRVKVYLGKRRFEEITVRGTER